jgi:hypothetical protein
LTLGIIFFGAPHSGLHTDDLEGMIAVHSGEHRRNLIMQLKEGSEFLETQKEDLMNVWKRFKGKLVSFFETVKTKLIQEVIAISCLACQRRRLLTSFRLKLARSEVKEKRFKGFRDFLLSYICLSNTESLSTKIIPTWSNFLLQ